MKNLYSCFLALVLCVTLSGCSAKLPITKWAHSGQMSGAIWYTQKDKQNDAPNGTAGTPDTSVMSIPLLVHAEWEDTPAQKGSLALVFLHGNLLAKCQYDDAELVCETNNSFLGTKKMAYDCAMLVSVSINNLQGISVNVPSKWDFKDMSIASKHSDNSSNISNTDNNISPRAFSLENKNTKIVLRIKEATWR